MVEQMDARAAEHLRSLARYANLARFIFRFMFYADTLATEHLTSRVGIEFEPGPFFLFFLFFLLLLVHYEDNWNEKRVPSMNFNRDVSGQSMDKVAALLKRENAQLWINHDKAQSDKVAKAPRFVE